MKKGKKQLSHLFFDPSKSKCKRAKRAHRIALRCASPSLLPPFFSPIHSCEACNSVQFSFFYYIFFWCCCGCFRSIDMRCLKPNFLYPKPNKNYKTNFFFCLSNLFSYKYIQMLMLIHLLNPHFENELNNYLTFPTWTTYFCFSIYQIYIYIKKNEHKHITTSVWLLIMHFKCSIRSILFSIPKKP